MKGIVNGRILIPDGVIDQKVLTFDQRIAEIASEPPEEAEIIDAKGCYVAPGLIDVHCHGFMGWDTSRADLSDLRNMCAHLVRNGVTSWLPTTLTLPWPELEKCFTAIREVMRESALPEWRGGAQVLGCHAEGPFISPRRKGAQREEYIQRPDPRRIKPWASVIRLITVAPEVDGALDFIRAARRMGIAVSMGHSDATAEQDGVIIGRVAELAEKRGVTMTEISLAWLLTKVTAPVVGATKFHHVDGAAKATELELTEEEIAYLEAPYVPHPLAGVMAQNKPAHS